MLPVAARTFIASLGIPRGMGFLPLCVLAHAWHESAGFLRVIGQYNVWGIKVPRKTPWLGPVVTRMTTEYDRIIPGENQETALKRLCARWGRNDVRIMGQLKGMWKLGLPQAFIDFPTQTDAMNWYCGFVRRMYPLSYASRGTCDGYFNGLVGLDIQGNKVSGSMVYATDPMYVPSLKRVMRELQANSEVSALIQ